MNVSKTDFFNFSNFLLDNTTFNEFTKLKRSQFQNKNNFVY